MASKQELKARAHAPHPHLEGSLKDVVKNTIKMAKAYPDKQPLSKAAGSVGY